MSHISHAEVNNYNAKREQALSLREEICTQLETLCKVKIEVHPHLQERLTNTLKKIDQSNKEQDTTPITKMHTTMSNWNEDSAIENITTALTRAVDLHKKVERLKNDISSLENQSAILYEEERLAKEKAQEEERQRLLLIEENNRLKNQLQSIKETIETTVKNSILQSPALQDKILSPYSERLVILIGKIDTRTDTYDEYIEKAVIIKEEFDVKHLQEEERWKTLESIAKSMENVNLRPSLSYNEKEDSLIIRASKLTGETINFTLRDTKLHYEFDNYEGDSCFDASEDIELLLQDVYGIKLDDKKIIKGNPDRIKKTAKTNPVAPKFQQK